MVQDRAIFIMADQQKVVHGPSHRAIFNDLERPQTKISRSDHSLRLNISEMAKDWWDIPAWEFADYLSRSRSRKIRP